MSRYLNLSDRFGAPLPEPRLFGRLPQSALDIPGQDVARLRALGARKHALAVRPEMEGYRALWTRANDLLVEKPPIMMDEICWNELSAQEELALFCTHPFAKELEDVLVKELFRAENRLGNVIVDDFIETPPVIYDSGFGIDEQVDIARTDAGSDIVSRHFHILIQDENDVEKIVPPEIFVDWERTEQYAQLLREIFDGVIDVRVVGARGLWFTPWDYLIRVMGVEETMYNLYDEPEFVEKVVKRYVDCAMVRMEAYRKLGVWASNNSPCRVGSGGYGLISCLQARDAHPLNCPTDQMWGCGNAQIFSSVSPDMHWQFSLQYEMEWLRQFGVTYYGCCEPLSDKMDIMDRIPNLRKVSMSPWNNFDAAAERCRGKYVMSCKPSPAVFATPAFDESRARADIRAILEKTQGCAKEIVMKDISTLAHDPARLIRWAQIAQDCVDGYFR